MDLETLEAQLRHAEWRVALSEMQVYDLTQQIEELGRGGHDHGHAVTRFAELQAQVIEHLAHRDLLKKELESCRAACLAGECDRDL